MIKKEFSRKDQVAIDQFLMHLKKNKKQLKGATALAPKQFKCNGMTMPRIQQRAFENNCRGTSYVNVDSLKQNLDINAKIIDKNVKHLDIFLLADEAP